MEQNDNAIMIKNILTLRYDPSIQIQRNKFSSSDFQPVINQNYLENIENIIISTIKKHVTENRITVALSGGVDSTLVLALLRKALPEIKIDAISVKFIDSVDETDIASSISRKFNADHHIITINNFLEELPKAISIIKMPFWDTHWYHLVKIARQFSKSLISGDGGDELFGGYTFRYEKFLSNVKPGMKPKEKVKLYLDCHQRDWVPDQEKLFEDRVNFSWDEIYSKLTPYFDNSLTDLDQVFLADINGKLLFNWTPLNTAFHKHFDLNAIIPLLSEELIKYSLHIKNSLKYNQESNVGKLPLRKILEKYIDPNLITSNKQGFSVNTINLWKIYGKKLCRHYLKDARIVQDKWINEDWIKNHLEKIDQNIDVRYVNKFLGLLAFEIWYRLFITKEMKPDTTLQV